MKILNILNEQLSPVLFHSTHPKTAQRIIETNTFKLSSTLAKQSEQGYNEKLFYLSTTRSKLGNYHQSSHYMLTFKLDGRMLNNNFGGHAVDYWGRDFRNSNPTRNEMEDRVVSDKPEIKDASKYIISLDFFAGERYIQENFYIADLVKACIDHGVQFNLFLSEKDFYAGKRAISNQDAYDRLVKVGPREQEYAPRVRESFLAPYIELLNYDNSNDTESVPKGLSENAQRVLKNIVYYDDGLRMLKADFHNENTHDDSRKFTIMAKKLKLKTLADIIEFIKNKYKRYK